MVAFCLPTVDFEHVPGLGALELMSCLVNCVTYHTIAPTYTHQAPRSDIQNIKCDSDVCECCGTPNPPIRMYGTPFGSDKCHQTLQPLVALLTRDHECVTSIYMHERDARGNHPNFVFWQCISTERPNKRLCQAPAACWCCLGAWLPRWIKSLALHL